MKDYIHAPIKTIAAFLFTQALLPLALLANDTQRANTVIPSRLVPDARNILRLHAGNDGKDAIALAEELAQTPQSGYLVIVVMTNHKYEEQAIAHGLKLQAWFERQISTRDHVPLVVHKSDKGVGYIYNMWGGPYFHEEHAKFPHGVMSVQGSVAVLDDARITHIASMHIKSEADMAISKSNQK